MPESIYQQFDVPEIINGIGYATRVGGSCPSPGVLEAMRQASQAFVELDDLQAAASRVIAKYTGAEAGIVTCGATAGLALSAAACLARNDVDVMDRLPAVSSLPRHEIIYPFLSPYDYDHAVRLSGAKLVQVEYLAPDALRQIEANIDENTAAIGYVWQRVEERPNLSKLAGLAHRYELPLFVDAAKALPPVSNLKYFIDCGADLVTFSGGKHLQGPQASGVLCGREDLIRSAWLQMADMDVRESTWSLKQWMDEGWIVHPPRHGIGRAMKVGKEAIIGLMFALEEYSARDHAAESAAWQTKAQAIAQGLSSLSHLRVEYLFPAPSGQPFPVVQIESEHKAEIIRLLREEHPKVLLDEDEVEPHRAFLYPMCLRDGDVERVIAAFRCATENLE